MHYSVESSTTDTDDITGDLDVIPARQFLVPDGATGDWDGWNASIAIRNPSLGLWSRVLPRIGDHVYSQDDEVELVYTTHGYKRVHPLGLFQAYKSGSQSLTGSYADITGWSSPRFSVGDLATIDTSTGIITLERMFEGLLRVQVSVEMLYTSGTQGINCSMRLLIDPGDSEGFVQLAEGFQGFITTQPRKPALLDYFIETSDVSWTTTPAKLKLQAVHLTGSGTADVAAAQTHIILSEVRG